MLPAAHAPLVGRARAVATLQEALERARRGRGGALAIVGEAGIGKSRLVRDVTAGAGTVHEGRCIALGGEPLRHAALVDLLRSAGPAEGTLAGATTEQLLERMLGLVELGTEEAPIVLVVEDVHWADRATCEVLMVLARHVASRPATLLMTCRDDELPLGHYVRMLLAELGQAELVTTVQLRRLGPADVAQLIEHLTGPVDDITAAAIFHRSAGNPLLVRELCAGDFARRGATLPDDVPMLDVLLARAERLSPAGRQVAAALATAGRPVDAAVLAEHLSAVGDDLVAGGLREALDHHLLVRHGDVVEFHHVLVSEAVARKLLPTERRALHRRWAEVLRTRAAAGVLAHHWAEAGEPRRALSASITAGDLAAADLAAHDAFGHYRRALHLWDQVEEPDRAAGCSFVELSRRTAEVANRSGNRDVAVEVIDAARRTIDAADDPTTASVLAERRAWYLLRLGRSEEADRAYTEAVELLPDDAAPAVRAAVLAGTVRAAEQRLDADAALARAQAAMDAAVTAPQVQVHAHYMLARALLVANDWAGAEREFVAAVASAEEHLEPVTGAVALADLSELLAPQGRLAEALAVAVDSAARLRAAGWVDPNATLVDGVAASMELRRGDVSAARAFAEAVMTDARASVTLALGHVLMGWCDLEDAAFVEAREHVEMARFLAAPLLDGRLGGTLAVVRAEIAMAEGHGERARAAIDEGVRMVATTGDEEVLGQLGLLGLRIVRDRNQQLDRRSAAGAKHQLEDLRDRYEGVVEDAIAGRPGRRATTALATELAAERAHPDPASWLAAATAWDAVVWPRFALRARLAAAVASFEVGDRASAAAGLDAVAVTAAELGNRALAEEAERIARRAGLRVSASAGAAPAATPSAERLTARELEVLELLAAGATNRQISHSLFISEKTASVHVSRILTKLGVTSRAEAATVARRHRQ